MKMTGITITKAQFESEYSVFDKEGIFKGVKATGINSKYVNEALFEQIEGYDHTILVNLKAVESRNIPDILALFEGREMVDLAEFTVLTAEGKKRNLLFTHSILITEGAVIPRLPLRNQEVTVQLQYARDNNNNYKLDLSGQKIINVKYMDVQEPDQINKFSFSKYEQPAIEKPRIEFGEESDKNAVLAKKAAFV